jgi:uncharacterized caspase-like protein
LAGSPQLMGSARRCYGNIRLGDWGSSRHGTEQHQLVTYDTDPKALATSGIPLDELTDWFKKVPARHLVLLLDCCFSGGAGAKVLESS